MPIEVNESFITPNVEKLMQNYNALHDLPTVQLDECYKTKLPGFIGWNMIKLAHQVFIQKYGTKSVQQVLVCSYFPSFVYSTTTKQVESRQNIDQYYWTATAV